jgi:hypothetical protein
VGVSPVAEQWQTEKLQFVGEQVGLNEYEAACSLAEDCDLSGGVLRPRLDDFRTTTSAAQRACMVDVSGGTLRWKNSSGYCFAYGDDAYFLNADGSWTWVKPDGSEQTLTEPPQPTIQWASRLHRQYIMFSGSGANWNVTPNPELPPTWSNVSGSITRTFTFSSTQDWSGAKWLYFPLRVPRGAESSLVVAINGNDCPTYFKRHDSTSDWLWVWADCSQENMSNFTSFGFRYEWSTSHTLVFAWSGLWGEGGVPSVQQVYVATIERSGVESVLSAATEIVPKPYHPYPDIPSGAVRVRVSGVQSGDVVRLYRAVEGQYVRVSSGTASGSTIDLDDWGTQDTGEYYRPSGELPYGPAVVVGNRAVVAAGRTLWISQAGNPTRYGATAINEDNLDAYTVVLPAAVDAIAPAEGGVIAHTRRGQYLISLSPIYDNDLLHVRPPVLIDERAAGDFRAAAFGAFISDGRLYVDGQLVASGLNNNSWVLRTAGRVYVISGTTCYVWSPAEWQGAVRWTLPASAEWVFTYGDDVFIATASASTS